MLLQPLILHFNQKIWGPDAETFNPDRHSPEMLEKVAKDGYPLAKDPYSLITFANGPRTCIAKSFAMLEIKAILVELIKNWRFERAWEGEIGFQNAITLRPKGGVRVRVTRVE